MPGHQNFGPSQGRVPTLLNSCPPYSHARFISTRRSPPVRVCKPALNTRLGRMPGHTLASSPSSSIFTPSKMSDPDSAVVWLGMQIQA